MEWFIIYLFVMIEKISTLLDKGYTLAIIGGFLCVVMVILALLFTPDEKDGHTVSTTLAEKPFKSGMRLGKFGLIIGLILGISGNLIPDQKQLAIIVGSGVTYNVLTSDPAKRIGGKALQLIEQKVDDALKDEPVREKIQEKAKAAIVEKIEGAPL